MPALLLVLILALCIPPGALAGALSVTVQDPQGKPVPGAVLLVYPLGRPARPRAPVRAVMDQLNRTFVPDLLVIPVGSTVEFPNTDTTSHQVYSFSAAHPFQLPLYRGKPYPPQHFDQTGLVTLGCNIHDEMLGYILVTDADFFGRTDGSGQWSDPKVPAGRYRIELWHPRLREPAARLARELTLSDADPAQLTIGLSAALRPALAGRSHRWDGY